MNIEKTIQIRASSAKTVCISLLCARTSCGAFLWIMREAATRVELRFFSGLSVEETAEFLRISPETVLRDWKMAKVWLLRELSRHSTPPAARS
jgi:ECF sigma factor